MTASGQDGRPRELSPRLAPGQPAPRIDLPDSSGARVGVEFSAHAATVVVFTSAGCPFALAWHDRVEAVGRDYADRDVLLVQVVSNDPSERPEDAPAAAASRVGAGHASEPYLIDADQAVAVAYGTTATPEVFVVDRGGVVLYHGAPDGDHDDPSQRAGWVREALDAVLQRREPGRPATSPAGCSVKWRVEVLWSAGCPTHDDAVALVRDVLDDLARPEVRVVDREVRTRAEAEALGLAGSPTIQVGRRDVLPVDSPAASDGSADGKPDFGCRVYPQPDGRVGPLPDRAALAAALTDLLARPWDLPGWVDPRKKGSSA